MKGAEITYLFLYYLMTCLKKLLFYVKSKELNLDMMGFIFRIKFTLKHGR
jgi:hypothetical protein